MTQQPALTPMLRSVFLETTRAYWEIMDRYPSEPLDQEDCRRSAAEFNLFAVAVANLSQQGWPREMVLKEFDRAWQLGESPGDDSA
jgi:hypothetical protein